MNASPFTQLSKFLSLFHGLGFCGFVFFELVVSFVIRLALFKDLIGNDNAFFLLESSEVILCNELMMHDRYKEHRVEIVVELHRLKGVFFSLDANRTRTF